MEVLQQQSSPSEAFVENGARDNSTTGTEPAATSETARQESHLNDSLQLEAPPAPENNALTSSLDLMSKETEEISPDIEPEDWHTSAETNLEMQSQEMLVGTGSTISGAATLKANDAGSLARPPIDTYGLGVRVMRISPLWLLLTGLSFISFIVLCNWIIKPTEGTRDTAGLIVATNNQATNQSINRVASGASTAQSPVNNQLVQPVSESGAAFIATGAKEPSVSQPAAPDIEMNEVKSIIEEKPAPLPDLATASAGGGAQAGKFTIQIGSYNEAAQAEERVVNLKSGGFEARSVAVEIPQRGTWYRVQSGRFPNRNEAERYGKQLRDKGVVSSFITADIHK